MGHYCVLQFSSEEALEQALDIKHALEH
jgi:hypothetical protein